ncbi:MAG: trehalose-6-phosphate synthase [Phycisphaerae bacterium]|nr:MAG: trehalose-6-phosphate synthase [Phycisphaerae bacterium]
MRSEPRVIVVANRLPVTRGRGEDRAWDVSPGGLVTALMPTVRERRGAWVGWPGSAERGIRPFSHEGVSIRPVTLGDAEIRDYYHGFSNRTLWPLYHDAIRTPEFQRHWWRAYLEVNRRFARAAANTARGRDIVWVQDFHLQLVPGMLRELRPDLRIGFFLHIPFPPEELFAWLPWREEILRGLCGADVVGFQTAGDAQNFSRLARRFLDLDGTDTELHVGRRKVRVGAFPISIDFSEFDQIAARPETLARAKEIRKRLGGRKVILCVDRLDYTKGIDLRLATVEQMLDRGELDPARTVLVQVAVPSRETVQEYADLRTTVEQAVGRINGEYSQVGRVAVHYFRRNLSREELVAHYRAADVMMVTPLRDGMNLVAKEFCASRPDLGGVLVLSEFAGASRQLRRALLVNPRDIDGTATTLREALAMRRGDGRQRMAILRMMVRRHDVHVWAHEFLEALA